MVAPPDNEIEISFTINSNEWNRNSIVFEFEQGPGRTYATAWIHS